MNKTTIIIYNIIILFNIYFIITAMFTIIYIILDYAGIGFIIDHYSSAPHQEQFIDTVTRSFYFSYITMFAVGYGDMTPFGLSKAVSIIQAFTGHILPYVIMLNYIICKPSKFFKK